MIVIADSCAIIAAYDDDDPDTEGCAQGLAMAGLVVVSPLVLAEVDHIATRLLGRAAAREIVKEICNRARILRATVPEVTPDALGKAEVVRDRYRDLDLDLADAVNVVLAEEYATDCVLTIDRRDFRTIRPLTHHKAFRLLPDDA